jgi:hypothetical protein
LIVTEAPVTHFQCEEKLLPEPGDEHGSGYHLFKRLEQRYQLTRISDLIAPSILAQNLLAEALNGPFSLRVAVKEEFCDDGFFQIRVDLQARQQTIETSFFFRLGQVVESAFFEHLYREFPENEVTNLKGYLIATTVYFNRMAIT